FDTLQQGISFYENYARVSSFDTRLYSTKKRKSDGKISLKYCVCNKEGFREIPRFQSNCKKKRPITRMGTYTSPNYSQLCSPQQTVQKPYSGTQKIHHG
ncbi:Protein FAR1-RELATED SEQUENCE 5, partial [Bienertia sinuspersici]